MNKRIICLMLVLALSISLNACGSKSVKDPTIPAAEPATEAVEATTEATNVSGEDINPTETVAQNETETVETDEETVELTITDGNGETLPSEVEVSIGVEKVENDGSIDVDISATQPSTTTPPATTAPTVPTDTTTPPQEESTDSSIDIMTLTYEQYIALSGEDQKKVIAMFGSADDFVRWYKAVEAKYKAEHPDVEIGDSGNIDAGNLAG